MAKKNQSQGNNKAQKGTSKPESFTHGMISDLDPHFQLEGSYTDAQNIRLTNSTGDTFTVENIEGNSLFVDLATFHIDTIDDQYQTNASYPTFYDRGPTNDLSLLTNLELSNRCSIVGHVSYASRMLLMIVGRFEWNRGYGVPFAEEKNRTIFLMVDFNHEFRVQKVTDLRVCYEALGQSNGQYPDLNMDLDTPVRIEHIVENESISRIYWTDNKNQLRTLNINQPRLDLLEISSLDISPLMNPSQAVLGTTLNGSLPVGVYQYCYKYISENGGESTFSPLSNMYHVSDQAFGTSTLYGGGPQGNLGTQGFQIEVNDIDQTFEYIELYGLLYEEQNNAPRVCVITRNRISGTKSIFQHVVWNNEIENGLEEILIESNTFDVCKDIAIKDNILFAANLRQKRNFISEKEWNVKIMRWVIKESDSGPSKRFLSAMLTTNDREVKHYKGTASAPVEIGSTGTGSDYGSEIDINTDWCGYGQLLGSENSAANPSAYPSTGHSYLDYDGNLNNPMWTTCVANQRHGSGGSDGRVKHKFEYRYLADRMTLGGESFEYSTNGLGGCRVTFGIEEKVADQSQNAWNSPFISSTSKGDKDPTEFFRNSGSYPYIAPVGNTTFKSSMSLGGSKDPHLAGNKRGYQRGDIYRFGVQIYDLNGAPGNVLWIGDIETPNQHDVLRMLRTDTPGYNPARRTIGGSGNTMVSYKHFTTHQNVKDHRLSYIYGHTVPPVDVEWFTARIGNSTQNLEAYIRPDGERINSSLLPNSGSSNYVFDIRNKAMPAWDINPLGDAYGMDYSEHNETHYLYDLYVNFEFVIPEEVVKKISGYRVVRAERTEEDRRIIQQGLLNQTAQYGTAKYGQKYGYDSTRFSQKDNEAFSDDPIFVNQYNSQLNSDGTATNAAAITPTLPEQPEYNVYLNGYLGLAENSHLAFYDSVNVTDGKATTGGNTEGNVFYWPEREDSRQYNPAGGAENARRQGANSTYFGGPGTYGTHHRHSAYFGSYDKLSRVADVATTAGDTRQENQQHSQISGSIFTLDAPDSAFGIRPYVYREGDMLRIDSSLKLSDEVRFKGQPGSSFGGASGYPNHFWSHCRGMSKKNHADGVDNYNWDSNGATNNQNWTPEETDHTLNEALSFTSRKEIDDDYAVLIGKYYCYDPYFGIGMEIDGGKFAGASKSAGSADMEPQRQYGWQLPIASSKEITDGEIIPSGFFKISKRVKYNKVNGFSNNTLGYVKKAHIESQTGFTDNFIDTGVSYVFGAVSQYLAHIKKTTSPSTATDPIADFQWPEVKNQDYTYDTVSTMQMGLRSIIVEVDNRYGHVRQRNADGASYFGLNADGAYAKLDYHAWFAPLNLSALYEHSNWKSEDLNGNTGSPTPGGYNPETLFAYRSGFISHKGSIGLQEDGSEEHDNGPLQKTNNKGKDLVPFKYLCSIVRNTVAYGGYTKGAIEKTRYIPCGNFHAVDKDGFTEGNKQSHLSKVFGGDTFVNLYSHQKTATPYMKKSAARWQVFPVESYVNTDMRSGLTLNSSDTVIGKEMNEAPFSNDWLYNSIYSQENNIKSSLMVNEEKFDDSLNLPYEIAYSNTKILGQTSDAFRVFPINQFHDMEGLYGEINRIINFKNEIYVLQDSAFAKLLVNPLSMLSDDSGTSLFTGTGETVESHIYISTKYGSRHRFSVALSEKSLYFVDSNFGRLFKYDTEKLISLGDALGQRNYLKTIIKEWEQRAYKICQANSGSGGSAGGTHVVLNSSPLPNPTLHGTNYGLLDSVVKPDGSRNYLADNPLNFLGITSIYDYTHKELLVTFHNSAWGNKNNKRQQTSRTADNHGMGSSTHGEPVGHSETLVYSEAINAFTSKYSVAPPQWLTGGQGSFIVCPENEINVNTIANFSASTGLHYPGGANYGSKFPYSLVGSNSSLYRDRRCNPLKLWIWDKHIEKNKTNFFGKKDDVVTSQSGLVSPLDSSLTTTGYKVLFPGRKDVADESYIVKVINSEAASSKVFDNSQIIMTPEHVKFSFIDYTTDITHDTINIKSPHDLKTTNLDETEQLVLNRRWEFDSTTEGWIFNNGGTGIVEPLINTGQQTLITSVDHPAAAQPDGKYFYFDELTMSNMLGVSASIWDNTTRHFIQIRNGVEIWDGDCVIWDSSSGNSTPTTGSGNSHGRRASGASAGQWQIGDIIMTSTQGSNIVLQYEGLGAFRTPNYKMGDQINLPGKYNNIIRVRVRRSNIGLSSWLGRIKWRGYDPIRKASGDYLVLSEATSRSQQIEEPLGLDEGFIIAEWDMSGTPDWNDCIIEQINLELFNGTAQCVVDWVEIGGLQADKYIDGILKTPLRTEKSSRRTRGTWAKIKYSAKTTDKFNIFAILAKYRKTY